MDVLKGNYKVKDTKKLEALASEKDAAPATAQQEFEKTALEKLGGSIAFVKKSAAFVWKGGK